MTHLPMGSGDEFDRIRGILDTLGPDGAAIGDDTATLPDGAGSVVVSTDTSVEHVHFRRDWLTLEEIGWRATAAALSDLAAAAAVPIGVTIATALPSGTPQEDVVALTRGIGAAVRSAGCRVLGGDLARASELSIGVTVFGRTARAMSRAGAQPGDGIWVTGVLGGARAALVEWQQGRVPSPAARLAFARPQSRHRAARWLAGQGATSMIDLSDGLAGDAEHVAAASGVCLEIDLGRLPIHPSVHTAAAAAGVPATHFAAMGGEDYELLVTMPAGFAAGAVADAATGVGLARIGEVTAGSGVRLLDAGRAVALAGFRHQL
jgi:thiamine-monophosphate kinase